MSWKLRPINVAERGVDGMHEVQAGVDQGTVQVEDQQLHRPRVKRMVEADHV